MGTKSTFRKKFVVGGWPRGFSTFARRAILAKTRIVFYAPVLVVGVFFVASGALAGERGLKFPSSQWGNPNLKLPQSGENLNLETLWNNNNDNFELISGFSETDPVRIAARPVGRLDLKIKGSGEDSWIEVCTAWIISKDYILTARHCLEKDGVPLKIDAIRLRLGYLSTLNPVGEVFDVVKQPVEAPKELDYAILKVIKNPSAKFGVVEIRGVSPIALQSLYVVQHPLGKPLRVVKRFCRVLPEQGVTKKDIRHRCDTLPGSSGAPVFLDREDVAIGLHYAGGLDDDTESFNSALRIDIVIENSKILKALLNERPQRPGVYTRVDLQGGTLIEISNVQIVTDNTGRIGNDGERPYDFLRDLKGACADRDIAKGTRLSWSDIGISC